MLVYRKNDICIIPLDFNVFFSLISSDEGYKVKYTKEYSITENFANLLDSFIRQDNCSHYILDMKNIISAPSRIFVSYKDYSSKVTFINVDADRIRRMIIEDLCVTDWESESHYSFDKNVGEEIVTAEYRKELISEKVKSVVDKQPQMIPLHSSGLYTNQYVNIKELFYNVEAFQFIIFSLAEVIGEEQKKSRIDAFVSSSKNGAIIANILAGLLDIKEVHLIGVGPKYAMEIGDSLEYIRSGKRYAYIYDFMCTGTEAKIVSALINSKKAYLPLAIGVARYSNKLNCFPIEDIRQLIETNEMGIDYIIRGEDNK